MSSTHRSAFGGDGVILAIVGWILTVLAVIVVALRGYAASHQNGKWRWDFIWSAATLVVGVAAFSLCFKATLTGLGNDTKNLTYTQVFEAVKFTWITIYVGLIATTFAKFSVVALLLQVQGPTAKKRKIALWVIGALFATTNLIQIFLSAFQCSPAERLWYRYLQGSCPRGRAAGNWNYLQGSIGASTDLLLALWPVTIAWNLQTTLRVKIGFCLLMAMGVLPAIASGIRTSRVPSISKSTNPTRDLADFMLWAIIEFWSIVILTSVPVLRPLFLRVFYGIKGSTYGRGTVGETHGTRGLVTANGTRGGATGTVVSLKEGKKGIQTLSMSVLDPSKDGSEEELGRSVGGFDGVLVTRDYDVRESGVELGAVKGLKQEEDK
ncbi:hypothetical protein B9Z65_7519 [Elsinoe australis]|uniref:Rhodopsin domain-containing protein n=1 Tax=Elsinoe australis TaxID=40998 RepID=A0A2P7YCE9_9PEZI|nr:hypothetical protein B9Z65_7519 [Elsinoe australis]